MVELITLIVVILFLIAALIAGYLLGNKITSMEWQRQWEEKIPEVRQDAINRSRAGLGGKFSENLAPYFPDFPFHPTELRWLGGSPVDYIAFNGMDENNIQEIVFLEIKSGKSQLTTREKQIKELVEKKKVRWEEYRVEEGVTK